MDPENARPEETTKPVTPEKNESSYDATTSVAMKLIEDVLTPEVQKKPASAALEVEGKSDPEVSLTLKESAKALEDATKTGDAKAQLEHLKKLAEIEQQSPEARGILDKFAAASRENMGMVRYSRLDQNGGEIGVLFGLVALSVQDRMDVLNVAARDLQASADKGELTTAQCTMAARGMAFAIQDSPTDSSESGKVSLPDQFARLLEDGMNGSGREAAMKAAFDVIKLADKPAIQQLGLAETFVPIYLKGLQAANTENGFSEGVSKQLEQLKQLSDGGNQAASMVLTVVENGEIEQFLAAADDSKRPDGAPAPGDAGKDGRALRPLTDKEVEDSKALQDAPQKIAKLNSDAIAGAGNPTQRSARDQAVVTAVRLAFETGGHQAVAKLIGEINTELAKGNPAHKVEFNGGVIGGTPRDQNFAISLQVTDPSKASFKIYDAYEQLPGTQVSMNELGQTKAFTFPGDRTLSFTYDVSRPQLVTSFKDADGNTWTRQVKDGIASFVGTGKDGKALEGKIDGEIEVRNGRIERLVNGTAQEFTGRTDFTQEALKPAPIGNGDGPVDKPVEIYRPAANSDESRRLLDMQDKMLQHMNKLINADDPAQRAFLAGIERERQEGIYGPETRKCFELLKLTVESNTKRLANILTKAGVAPKTGVELPFDPQTRLPMTPERYEAWLKDDKAQYKLGIKIPEKGLPSDVDIMKLDRSVFWLGEAQKRFDKAAADYQDKYIERMVDELGLPKEYTKARRGEFGLNEAEGRRAAMQMIEMYKQVQRTVDAARYLNLQNPNSLFGLRSDLNLQDDGKRFPMQLPPGWEWKKDQKGEIDFTQDPPFTHNMPKDLRLAAGANKAAIESVQNYFKDYGDKVKTTYLEVQQSLGNPVGMIAYEDVEVPRSRWTGTLGFNPDGTPKFNFEQRHGGKDDPAHDFNLIGMNFDVEKTKDGYYRVTKRAELWDLPMWAYQNARWNGVIGSKVGDIKMPPKEYKRGTLVPVKRGDSFELCRVENLDDDTNPLLAAVSPGLFIGSKLQSYKGERQVVYWGEKAVNVAMDILMTLEGLNGLRLGMAGLKVGAKSATTAAAKVTEGVAVKSLPAITRAERAWQLGTSGLKFTMGLPTALITTSAGSHDGSNKFTEYLGHARHAYFLTEAGGGLLFGKKFGMLLNPSTEKFQALVGTGKWFHPESGYSKLVHRGFKVAEWGVIASMSGHMTGLARQLPPDAPRGLELSDAAKNDPLRARFEAERDWLKASDQALTDDKTGISKEKEAALRQAIASVEGLDKQNREALLESGFKDPNKQPPEEDRWGDRVKQCEADLLAKRTDLEAAQKKPKTKPEVIQELKRAVTEREQRLEIAKSKHELLTGMKSDLESPDLTKRASELGSDLKKAQGEYLAATKGGSVADADLRRGRLEANLQRLKTESPQNVREISRCQAELQPIQDLARKIEQLTKRHDHLNQLLTARNGFIDYLQPPQSVVQDMISKGTYEAEKANGFANWQKTLDPERVVAAKLALLRLGDRDGAGALREPLATRSFEVTVMKEGKPVKEIVSQSVSSNTVVRSLEAELSKPTSQLRHFTKQDIEALRQIKTDAAVLGQVISPRDTIKGITERTQQLLDSTSGMNAQQRREATEAYKRDLMKHIPEEALKAARDTEKRLNEIMNSDRAQDLKDEQIAKALKEFRDGLKGNPEVQAAAIYSLMLLSRNDQGGVQEVLAAGDGRSITRDNLGLYLNMFLAAAIKDEQRVPGGVDLVLANLLSKLDPSAMSQGRLMELANDVCRRNPSEQIKDWAQMIKMGGDLSSQGMERSRKSLHSFDMSDPEKLKAARETVIGFAPGLTANLKPDTAKQVKDILDKAALMLDPKTLEVDKIVFRGELAKHFRPPLADTEEAKALRAAAGLSFLYLSRDRYGNLPDNFASGLSGEAVVEALKSDFIGTKTPESAARIIALGDMLSRAGIVPGATFAARLHDVLVDPRVSQEDKMRALVDANGPRLSAVIEAVRVHEALKQQYGKAGDEGNGDTFGVSSVDLLKTLEKVSKDNPGTPVAALAADLKFAHLQTDAEERQKRLLEVSKRGVDVLEKRADGKALESSFVSSMLQFADLAGKNPSSSDALKAYQAACALADYAPSQDKPAKDKQASEKLATEIDVLQRQVDSHKERKEKAELDRDARRVAEIDAQYDKDFKRLSQLRTDMLLNDPQRLQSYINDALAGSTSGQYKDQAELRAKAFDTMVALSEAKRAGKPAEEIEKLRKEVLEAQNAYVGKEQLAEDLVVRSLERLLPDRLKQLGKDNPDAYLRIMTKVGSFTDSPVRPEPPVLPKDASPADKAEYARKLQKWKEHPAAIPGRERMHEENQAKVIAMLPGLLNPDRNDPDVLRALRKEERDLAIDKLAKLISFKGMNDYPLVGEAAVKAIGAFEYRDAAERSKYAEMMRTILLDNDTYPPLVRRAALEEMAKLNPPGLERTYLDLLGRETDSEINKRIRELILPFRRPEPTSKEYIDDFERAKRELTLAAVRGNFLSSSKGYLYEHFRILDGSHAHFEANRRYNESTGLNDNNPLALIDIAMTEPARRAKLSVQEDQIKAIQTLKERAEGTGDGADQARKALAYIIMSNGMPGVGSEEKDRLVTSAAQKLKEACEANPKERSKDFAQILEMCLMHQPSLSTENRERLLDAMKALRPGEFPGGITKEQAAVAIAAGLQLNLSRTRGTHPGANSGFQTKAIETLSELGVKKVLPVLEAVANADDIEHKDEAVVLAARRAVSKMRDDTSLVEAQVKDLMKTHEFSMRDLVAELESKLGKGGRSDELVKAIYMAGERSPIKEKNDPRAKAMLHVLASDRESEQAKIAAAKVLSKSEVPELRTQAIELLALEASFGTRKGFREDASAAIERIKKEGKDAATVEAANKLVAEPIKDANDIRATLLDKSLASPDPAIRLESAQKLIKSDNPDLRKKAIETLAVVSHHGFRETDKKAARDFLESVKAAEKANPQAPTGFHAGDSKLIDEAIATASKLTSADVVQKLDSPVTFKILDNQRYYDSVKRNMLDNSYADLKQFEGDWFRKNGAYNLLDGKALNDTFDANFKRVRGQFLNTVKGTSTILADWGVSVLWYTNPITPWFDRPEHLHYNPDEEIAAANKKTFEDRDTQFKNLVDAAGRPEGREARMALAYMVTSNGLPFRADERVYFAEQAAKALKKICQDGNLERGELTNMLSACLMDQPGLSGFARNELFEGLKSMRTRQNGNIGDEEFAAIVTAALETEFKTMPVPGKPGFDKNAYDWSIFLQRSMLKQLEGVTYRKATPILEAMALYHPDAYVQGWASQLAMSYADRLGSYKPAAFAGEPQFPAGKEGEEQQLKWRADRLGDAMAGDDRVKLINAIISSGFEKPITDKSDPRRPHLRRGLEHDEPLVRMAAARLLLTSEDQADPDREKAYQVMKTLAAHGSTMWFRKDASDLLEGLKGGNEQLKLRARTDVEKEKGEEQRLTESIAAIEAKHGANTEALYNPLCQLAQLFRAKNTPQDLARAREIEQRASAIGDSWHLRYRKEQEDLAAKSGDESKVLKSFWDHSSYLRGRDWAGDAEKADQLEKTYYNRVDQAWVTRIDNLKKQWQNPPTPADHNALATAQKQYADSMRGSKDPRHQELCKKLGEDSAANVKLAWDTTIGGVKSDIAAGRKTHDDLSSVYTEQANFFKATGDTKGQTDAVRKSQEATIDAWKARIKTFTDRQDKLSSAQTWQLSEQMNGQATALIKRDWPGDKQEAEKIVKQSTVIQEKAYDLWMSELDRQSGGKDSAAKLAGMAGYSDYLRQRNAPGDMERAKKFEDKIEAAAAAKLAEFKKAAGVGPIGTVQSAPSAQKPIGAVPSSSSTQKPIGTAPSSPSDLKPTGAAPSSAPTPLIMDKTAIEEFKAVGELLLNRGRYLNGLALAPAGAFRLNVQESGAPADKKAIAGDAARAAKLSDAGRQIQDGAYRLETQRLEAAFGPDSPEVLTSLKAHARFLSADGQRDRASRLIDLGYKRELAYWDKHSKIALEKNDPVAHLEALGKKVSVIEELDPQNSYLRAGELDKARSEYRETAKKLCTEEIERIEKSKGKNAVELIKPLSDLSSFLCYGRGASEEDRRLGDTLHKRSYEIEKEFKGKREDIPASGPLFSTLTKQFKDLNRASADPEATRELYEIRPVEDQNEVAIIDRANQTLAIKGLKLAEAKERIKESQLPDDVSKLYVAKLESKALTPDCAAKLAQMDPEFRQRVFDPLVKEGKTLPLRLEQLVDLQLRNQARRPERRLNSETMDLLASIKSSDARQSVESLATHWSIDATSLKSIVTANGGASISTERAATLSRACANGLVDGETLVRLNDVPADKRSVLNKLLADQLSVAQSSQIDAAAFKKLVEASATKSVSSSAPAQTALSIDELRTIATAMQPPLPGKTAVMDGNSLSLVLEQRPDAVKTICAYLKTGGQSADALNGFLQLAPEDMTAVVKKGLKPADLNFVLENFAAENVPKVVASAVGQVSGAKDLAVIDRALMDKIIAHQQKQAKAGPNATGAALPGAVAELVTVPSMDRATLTHIVDKLIAGTADENVVANCAAAGRANLIGAQQIKEVLALPEKSQVLVSELLRTETVGESYLRQNLTRQDFERLLKDKPQLAEFTKFIDAKLISEYTLSQIVGGTPADKALIELLRLQLKSGLNPSAQISANSFSHLVNLKRQNDISAKTIDAYRKSLESGIMTNDQLQKITGMNAEMRTLYNNMLERGQLDARTLSSFLDGPATLETLKKHAEGDSNPAGGGRSQVPQAGTGKDGAVLGGGAGGAQGTTGDTGVAARDAANPTGDSNVAGTVSAGAGASKGTTGDTATVARDAAKPTGGDTAADTATNEETVFASFGSEPDEPGDKQKNEKKDHPLAGKLKENDEKFDQTIKQLDRRIETEQASLDTMSEVLRRARAESLGIRIKTGVAMAGEEEAHGKGDAAQKDVYTRQLAELKKQEKDAETSERRLFENLPDNIEARAMKAAVLIGSGKDEHIHRGEVELCRLVKEHPHLVTNKEFRELVILSYAEMAATREIRGLGQWQPKVKVDDIVTAKEGAAQPTGDPLDLLKQANEVFFADGGIEKASPLFEQAIAAQKSLEQKNDKSRLDLFIVALGQDAKIAQDNQAGKDVDELIKTRTAHNDLEKKAQEEARAGKGIDTSLKMNYAFARVASGKPALYEDAVKDIMTCLRDNPEMSFDEGFKQNCRQAFKAHAENRKAIEEAAANKREEPKPQFGDLDLKKITNSGGGKDAKLESYTADDVTGPALTALGLGIAVAQFMRTRSKYHAASIMKNSLSAASEVKPIEDLRSDLRAERPARTGETAKFEIKGTARDGRLVLQRDAASPPPETDFKEIKTEKTFNPDKLQFEKYTPVEVNGKQYFADADGRVYKFEHKTFGSPRLFEDRETRQIELVPKNELKSVLPEVKVIPEALDMTHEHPQKAMPKEWQREFEFIREAKRALAESDKNVSSRLEALDRAVKSLNDLAPAERARMVAELSRQMAQVGIKVEFSDVPGTDGLRETKLSLSETGSDRHLIISGDKDKPPSIEFKDKQGKVQTESGTVKVADQLTAMERGLTKRLKDAGVKEKLAQADPELAKDASHKEVRRSFLDGLSGKWREAREHVVGFQKALQGADARVSIEKLMTDLGKASPEVRQRALAQIEVELKAQGIDAKAQVAEGAGRSTLSMVAPGGKTKLIFSTDGSKPVLERAPGVAVQDNVAFDKAMAEISNQAGSENKTPKPQDPEVAKRAEAAARQQLEAETVERAARTTEKHTLDRKVSPDRAAVDYLFSGKGLEVVGADGKVTTVKGIRKPLADGKGEVTYLVEGERGALVPDAELTKTIKERLAKNQTLGEGLKSPSTAVEVLSNYAQASQDVRETVGVDTAGRVVDYKQVAADAQKALGANATAEGTTVRFRSEAGIPMVVKFKPETGKKAEVRAWGDAEITDDKLAKLLEEMKISDPIVKEQLEKAMKEYLKDHPNAAEAKDFESCQKMLAKEIREGRGGSISGELREVFKQFGVEYEGGKPKFENGHLVLRPKTGEKVEPLHARAGGAFDKAKGKLVPIMMIVLAVAHASQDRPTYVVPTR